MPRQEGSQVWVIAALLSVCTLSAPVTGPISSGFAPTTYSGHWGIDFSAPAGSPVTAPAGGTVTFAGSVAGMRSVTIDHGWFRTSVSYLSVILAYPGMMVGRGEVVGLAGRPHGSDGVHLSVRVGSRYTDPEPWLACRGVGDGLLYLLPPDRR